MKAKITLFKQHTLPSNTFIKHFYHSIWLIQSYETGRRSATSGRYAEFARSGYDSDLVVTSVSNCLTELLAERSLSGRRVRLHENRET